MKLSSLILTMSFVFTASQAFSQNCAELQAELAETEAYVQGEQFAQAKDLLKEFEEMTEMSSEQQSSYDELKNLVMRVESKFENDTEVTKAICGLEEIRNELDAMSARNQQRLVELEEMQRNLEISETHRRQLSSNLGAFNQACSAASTVAYGTCMSYYGKITPAQVIACDNDNFLTHNFQRCLFDRAVDNAYYGR